MTEWAKERSDWTTMQSLGERFDAKFKRLMEAKAAAVVTSDLEDFEREISSWPNKCEVCGRPYKAAGCPWCADAAQAEARTQEEEIKRLGGLKAVQLYSLKGFDNKAAVDMCSGYPDINLYIWGAAGVGKTHLATAIIRTYQDGLVVKPAHIFRKCRGLKDGAAEQALINMYVSRRRLLIDDLGIEKQTQFSLSVLYEIIEARDMNYMTGLIVTSNLSLTALAERLGDDRISSRLAGMCRIVEITGKDRRIQARETVKEAC